jgi:hypothetical protein
VQAPVGGNSGERPDGLCANRFTLTLESSAGYGDEVLTGVRRCSSAASFSFEMMLTSELARKGAWHLSLLTPYRKDGYMPALLGQGYNLLLQE